MQWVIENSAIVATAITAIGGALYAVYAKFAADRGDKQQQEQLDSHAKLLKGFADKLAEMAQACPAPHNGQRCPLSEYLPKEMRK